jgi:succinyl-CoA synthetase alpha subunit
MKLKSDSKVLIQGITEPLATIYTARMKAYGTNIVAGVSPGEGGQQMDDLPIFDLVEQALAATGPIDTAIIFVQPYWVLDAALEAIAAGIRQIILVTGGIPPLDIVCLLRKAEATDTLILGPSSSGIVVPESILLGTQESEFYTPGEVGIISQTGAIAQEVAWELTQAGLGQSISVNLGKDAIFGSDVRQWLQILEEDDNTKAIVLVGQPGNGWETVVEYVVSAIDKPVVAYLAGVHAPPDKRLGHAYTMIAYYLSIPVDDADTYQHQIASFRQAKIPIAKRPSQIPELVKKALKK